MNICIKRNYLNEEWDSDDNLVLVNRTDSEYLDDATIGEIKMFRGKVSDEHEIKTDWLYEFLRKNSGLNPCCSGRWTRTEHLSNPLFSYMVS